MTDFGGILATTFSYVGSFYQACGKEGTVTILDISCAPKRNVDRSINKY